MLQAVFSREVAETFLRCVKHGYDQNYAVVELNGLKIAEDRTFADCARHMFTTILSLCLPAPPGTRAEYVDLFAKAGVDSAGAVRDMPWQLLYRSDANASQTGT